MVSGWRGWVRQDGRDGTLCRQYCNYYKYGQLSLLTSVSPTPLICTICGSSSVLDGNTWLHLYNPSQGSILKAAMSPGYPDLYHPPLRISVQPPESLSDPRQDRPGRVAGSELPARFSVKLLFFFRKLSTSSVAAAVDIIRSVLSSKS